MEELIINQRDLHDEIIKAINAKNLPAFIIKPVLKELYEQVEIAEQQQYQEALINNQKENEQSKKQRNRGEQQ